MREQGESPEADLLEAGTLARQLEEARASAEAEFVTPDAVANFFEREHARVADAAVIAELLLPRLQKLFSARPPLPAVAVAGTTTIRAPARPAEAASGSGAVPAIPDLLDAMLAHDRDARRPRNAA